MEKFEKIINLITGNTNLSERRETAKLINDDTEAKELYKKTKFISALISSKRKMDDQKVEDSYRQLRSRMMEQKRSSNFYPILKYAAIILIAFSLSAVMHYMGKQSGNNQQLQYTTVVADYGQISKVILPDSSVVWLNSGTKLTYNNHFSIDNRDLQLEGQAYLNVQKNKSLPLIVGCNDFQVKVLGTRFDVNAYPEDENISVTLESGSIELLHAKKKSFKHKMVPGEVAVYSATGNHIRINKIEPSDYTKWRTGLIVFQNAKMADVIKQLERKYGIEVEVQNDEVYKSVFNARFKNESLETIIGFIEFTCHIDAQLIKEQEINTKLILK